MSVFSFVLLFYFIIYCLLPLNCQSQQLSSALSPACDFKNHTANSVDPDQTAPLGAV